MADHYRVFGSLRWASQSGNALWTLTNPSNSTKLLRLMNVEIEPLLRRLSTSTFPQSVLCSLKRGTAWTFAGIKDPLTPTSFDTDDALPSTVVCGFGGDGTNTDQLAVVRGYKTLSHSVALSSMARLRLGGRYSPAIAAGQRQSADIEGHICRAGESLTLVATNIERGFPVAIVAQFVTESSPDRRFTTRHVVNAVYDNQVLWGVAVDSGGPVVRLEGLWIEEVGDTTTPFFQLLQCLPRSDVTDASASPTVFKLDTDSPAFPGTFLQDVVVSPANGIPEWALSSASAGTPQGLNYLHTKDFLGPVYAVYFPEHDDGGPGLAGDMLMQKSRRRRRIIDAQAPVVLRPGETVGLVTSAELATGTTAVALSGWQPFNFGIDVETDNLVTPTITFTGLETGTVIALVETGTETLVELLTESGGTASYIHDATGGDLDARILAPGFVFQQIDGIEQTAAVQTFPVQQTADLIYDGGLSEAVTFDGATKRIICDGGNTSINVAAVYTEWVDWALTANNLRFLHAFENQGGAVIDAGAGTAIPAYCYLVNSWRVRPQESSHTLAVTDGVLLVDGGGDPFVNTLAAYTVRILYQQPVQAIVVNTAGTVAPTQQQIRDAMALATAETPAVGSIDDKIGTLPDGAVVADGGNTASVFKTDLIDTVDNYWKDTLLLFTSGALAGQIKKISAYNGTTKVVTVSAVYTATPSAADTFSLVNR